MQHWTTEAGTPKVSTIEPVPRVIDSTATLARRNEHRLLAWIAAQLAERAV